MRQLNFFDANTGSDNIQMLNFSSPSERIAAKRKAVYMRVMENFSNIKENVTKLGLFSTASMDMQDSQLGVSLKQASLKAYLDSFVGYVAIERPLSQMTELLVYKDMITKGTGAVVLPMIGQQNPRQLASRKTTLTVTAGVATFTGNESIVPGSIKITYVDNNVTYTITDDRKGHLISIGGVLLGTNNTVNYETGAFTLNLVNTAFAGSANFEYSVDLTTDVNTGRIKPRQGHFLINAKINKFEYEYDLITAAISNKSLGGDDLAADMKQAVYDEHLMSINNSLVDTLITNYTGSNYGIDLSDFTLEAGRFESLLKYFSSQLISVDSLIAKNCYKVVTATAYIVGSKVGDLFNSFSDADYWVPNNTGFVNGLLGFYKGRAVLRHLSLNDNEGYAIHKTIDGELAPLALGIFLPATDLPNVGNFLDTNEIAGGIYSVEGVSFLTTDLAQKFTITFPANF